MQVVRTVVSAVFPAGVDLSEMEDRLATAIAGVVAELGGTTDVLRVAHALDPRWSSPLDPVPNRAGAR